MSYLLFAVLLYFVVRASRNLVRAVRGELDAPSAAPRFGRGGGGRRDAAYRRWQDRSDAPSTDPSNRERSSDTDPTSFWGDDVEDATWEDL